MFEFEKLGVQLIMLVFFFFPIKIYPQLSSDKVS